MSNWRRLERRHGMAKTVVEYLLSLLLLLLIGAVTSAALILGEPAKEA